MNKEAYDNLNTKTRLPGRGLRRLLAVFLCLLTVAGLLPATAFAASAGMAASSWVGDPYASSDGGAYYHPAPWHYMAYHTDGTTSYGSYNGGNSYKHYMLTDASGASRSVYCVESGIAFEGSDNAYLSENGRNSQYLSLLPAPAREGIMLASLYGWQPGASVPIPGINADDWKMAAQCIIWEYQQQLRSDPYSRHDNGPVSANQFYSVVAGRPAETAYHWILERIASHSVVPSFTSENAGSAPVLELEWDTDDKVYRLTVTDTNSLYIDLQALSGSGITVSRSGNSYTFTSTEMIENPVTLHFRKDIPVSESMLVWGRPGYQTMMTGAEDPVSFYVRIKTETYGTGRIAKTSEDGIVEGMLPYGRYTVHQVEGEAGKAFVPDFTVFISEDGQTYSYILNNDAITARIRVEKHDAETGNIIPLAGTGFCIRDLSTREFITQAIYYPNPMSLDIFYVSDEGWLMLPEPLEAGNYELLEVAAPYGYVLSSEPVPFTVDGSEATVTVTQSNMPQKGRITITKTGEVFASVQENDGFYQAVFEPMGLPGAAYDLIADEDIYTGDGTLRVAKDTVVETLTTGEDARAISSLLYLGRYRLEERQAPHGMVLDTEPVLVELSYAGQTVDVVETETGLYNMRQKVSVSLTKGMETDGLFGIGLADEYKDISFGLYAAHDLTALDGSVIPAGALMEAVTLSPVEGEAGTYAAAFAADLPFGGFFVQERTTNSAYVLDGTEYPVAFGYAGQDVAVVEIAANDGGAIINELIRGRIDGKKYGEDPAGGEDILLDGAMMGLFAADTEEFSEDNALLTVTTAEGGAFAFEDIPYGHWIVAEIAAPDLYSISGEQHHVYIGMDGQGIDIRMDNTLIRGSVQLVKTEAVDEPSALEDGTGNPFMRRLAGAVFVLYEDTNGDKKLDEGDTLMGTLAETEAGFHKAEGLLAKGFFVLEHEAPKGYQRDENTYYFEITQDGQTVVVENGEAGRGFTNEAYRGSLKIVKDSSDGRKDGFAFEVKSADGAYCETFTSGDTGVIEVEGLRAGKYTVTELSNRASRDYILPDAATVEIRAGGTSTVQFFNERPEDTPEERTAPGKPVPQTGDNNNMYIWTGLLALAAIGGGTFAVLWLSRGRGRHKKKNTDRKRDKAAMAAVFLICASLFVGSGFMLAQELMQYKDGADTYGEAADFVTLPETTPGAAPETEPSDKATETEGETGVVNSAPSIVLPEVDFMALKEKGPEVAAWLALPDTVINYPVAHTDDNDYYLTHLYDGTANKAGCLFIDYENAAAFTDKNTVIYGHNMRDGSMFSSLKEFSSQEYFDAHPSMYLVTPEGGYLVELFAAFTASPGESGSDASPWALSFKDDGAYTAWLAAMQERSLVKSGVSVTSSDNVLTLSTCTNSGSDRFIVMGKLVPVE